MTPRARHLKKRYGITEKQWDLMYQRQGGKCPICLRPIFRPGNKDSKRAASVDHDHYNHRVRGLVCFMCNKTRIGKNTAKTAVRLVEFLSSDFDGREI